jgi:hypothetical protein
MSYFDDASLVFIPSGTKTSKAYSVKPIDGTGDLTFSRSNDTATRVASNGLIERVRTNLALQSQTFDNASWVKAFATITANATTAPDGTLTADKLIANIGYDPVSATGNLRQTNIVATNTHTISLYAKAAEFTSIRFRENFIVGAFLTIDLTNGSITGAGSQYINPTATAVGDGWYRISFVTPATADLDKYSIRVANTGDGTSGVFIWGFQYEVSDFGATPYIATTSAAVSVGPVANVPRLDYLGSSCPRLLLEPQTTALNQFSEQIDNAYWTKSNSTATANQTASPSGYVDAELILDNTSNAQHAISTSIAVTSGNKYTASFFLKAAGYTTAAIRMGVGALWTGGTGPTVEFDLVALTGTVVDGSGVTFDIEDYGNGWRRCSVTGTCVTSGNTAYSLYVKQYNAYIGSGTDGVYAWGANITATGYLQSYIPTLGAAVTRGEDSASKTGIASLIGQSEGTLFVEYSALSNDLTYRSIGFNSGAATNRLLITFNNVSNNINFLVQVGGVTQVSINYSGATITSNLKVAFAYKENDFVAYVNGTQAGTDTSGSTYSSGTLTTFSFDNSVGADKLVAKLNQTLLFKTRLTNAQLAELTTL